ncbi:hypothetical protein OQY15_18930 [Pedobacter sp. MC2016-15]|uniref:hypothetical protein n=1 Tax=Pedobacter sp. MC2016-15 TaxID=2994473 RepID=UPI002245938A|nr:hypothetical protein [Pedobacter sp. MC2016-15]MCX2481187.1 hypothetical protein [Pedobacter sp. MC2016-15]
MTEANITSQADQVQNGVASGRFNGFVLGGDIWVKANSSTIPVTSGTAGSALPLNIARIKLGSISGINLGTINPEITLSTVDQSIASGGVTLGGNMFINYRLVIAGTAWQAGSYNVGLTFSASDATSRFYSVIVPAYLTQTSTVASTTALNVTSLADFRTNGVTATQTFSYNTSVPVDISLRAGPTISFSTTFPKITDPTLVASAVTATLSGTSAAGPQINLSTSNQALSTSSGIPVPVNNTSGTLTNTLRVTPASLQANFIQAGTYTYPLTYTIAKTAAAQPASLASLTMASTATVNVPRLFEANIPATGVNLNFSTPANYTSGVTVAAPAPITISSTIPYNVTVRASSNFTLNATTIPAGVMIIEGASGQTGVSSITLSTTAQTLISSSAPVLDRAVNLQYRIPSTQTSNLLNKAAGQYAADVLFTITAP